ncbi:MAG: sulfite exporter TauE/SafE family protein [Pseudobacteriovorax sp.]|nr:sulfite exporter TauE/SafE family protein [Pseudobacteriovorax sp.]
MDIVLTIVLGALVGISAALLGLGGNLLIVPLLPVMTQLDLSTTIATGIVAVFVVTAMNVLRFYRKKLLDLNLLLLLMVSTAMASFLSSYFSMLVPLQYIQGVFLIIMVSMLIKLWMPKQQRDAGSSSRMLLLAAGAFSGLLAGLTGVGTGVILGPLLLSSHNIDEKKVSPLINALIMVACFFSSFNYLSLETASFPLMGQVRVDYAVYLAVPALLTGIVGRRLNANISSFKRKLLVSGTLGLLIFKTTWESL